MKIGINNNRKDSHFPIGVFTRNFRNRPIVFLLIIFSIGINLKCIGQVSPDFNFKYVEKTSYDLYVAEQWQELIRFGKNALKHDHDYYYLHLRLGIAYYNMNNFFMAIHHLENAIRLNTSDTIPYLYLYSSYLFTKKSLDADILYKKNKRFLQNAFPDLKVYSNKIFAESGPIFSNNFEKNQQKNPAGENGILGIQDLNGNKFYTHIGWEGNPGKKFSLYAGIDYLELSKLKTAQTSEIVKTGFDTILYNGWFYIDTLYGRNFETYEYKYPLKQWSFFAKARFKLGKGYSITPSTRILFVDYTTRYINSTEVSYFAQTYDTIYSKTTAFSIYESRVSLTNYVLSLKVSKKSRNFEYSLFGSYSNLNNNFQYQAGAGINWFPFGNLDLYSLSQGISYFENNDAGVVYDQVLGYKIHKYLWIEGTVSVGAWKNFAFDNSFVAYNSGDRARFRTGANIILPLSDRFEFSIRYQFLKYQGLDEWYDENMKYFSKEISYNNNLIIGGLQWKF